MVTTAAPNATTSPLSDKLQKQFRGLDAKDPASWPTLPRYLLYFCITAFVTGALPHLDAWQATQEPRKPRRQRPIEPNDPCLVGR